MSRYEMHITEGQSHAALLELVLGNRRVRLTVDAEPIETATSDEAMSIARILAKTRGLKIWMHPEIVGRSPVASIIRAIQIGDAARLDLDRQTEGDPVKFFKATASRSFKLHALHDIGPIKAGQPVLVVHSDRGMVDCIPWPDSLIRIPADELGEQPPIPPREETSRTCSECQGAGFAAEEDAGAIREETCARCGGDGIEPDPKGGRWLGDTFIAAEATDPLNKIAGAEMLVDPVDLEGRHARVEPIPTELTRRIEATHSAVDQGPELLAMLDRQARSEDAFARATAIDKLLGAAERAALISGREHDDCPDHQLISKVADQIPGLLERVGSAEALLADLRRAIRRSNLDEVYEAHGEKFILPADVVEELKGAVPLLLERGDAEVVVALRAAAGANARVRELEAGIRRALDHLGSAREEDSLDRRDQYRAEAERELERVL